MIGRTISHYEIIEKLGEGGMGVVYKARDTKLDREVALKFLSSQLTISEEYKNRFIHEAKTVSSLDHPNICSIFEIGETSDGQLFIAMRAYDGAPLSRVIKDGPLSINQILQYSLQVASGLQAAHEEGIVHRDIKSGNILLTPKGQIKIIDFGLAKLQGVSEFTKTAKAVGSLAYMSPEQLRADEVDHRSDIFSLGVVMYEMIAGELPFKGEYEHVVMYSLVYQDPPPLSEVRSDVPKELEAIVKKCLEKDAGDRYQDISELQKDLERLLHPSGEVKYSETGTVGKPASDIVAKTGRKYLTLIGSILTLIIFIAILFTIRPFGIGKDPIPSDKYLAVLPFRIISDQQDDQAMSDGLMDVLSSKITQMDLSHASLWVVPASEVRAQGISSASEARRAFGVNLIVEGSLYRDVETVRVMLNLIDSNSLRQLRSWDKIMEADNMTTLHDDLIIHVVEMLEVELQPRDLRTIAESKTEYSDAYELYVRGRGYLQRFERVENIQQAIDHFSQALTIDNTYALAYAGIGEAYLRMYDATKDARLIELAIENCSKAIDLNPNLSSVHITLGMINYETGKYEMAVDAFKQALSMNPVHDDAYRGLARAYEALGNLDLAESTYKEAIRLKPGYWAGYNVLGGFYFRHNRFEEALENFIRVTEITPDNYRGYSNLGATYFQLGQRERAREMWERSLEVQKNADASSNLGTLHFAEGRYAEAARMYETALDLDKGNYLIWGNLASAYYWAPGERAKADTTYWRAIELVKESLTINPNDPYTVADLATYYAMVGEKEQSEMYLNRAIEMASRNSYVMFMAGSVFERIGERDKALYWLEQAVTEGYPIADIVHQPELNELIADERFQKMLQDSTQ
jgi:serine/threonine protein kinase/tetratricopeptide (TPR) repeat protein